MSIRPHLIALTLAVGVTAVAGCGSSTDAGSSPTSTGTSTSATSSTSTEPSTSTSSAPTPSTNSTAAGAPGVPEPARQHTKAGAIAFAKYYIKKVNETGLHPKPGVLEPLASPTCKTCKNLATSMTKLVSTHRHYSVRVERVKSARRIIGEKGMVIEVMVDEPKVSVLDRNGKVVQSVSPTKNRGLIFFNDWTSTGWRVHEIQIDDTQAS